MPTYGRVRYAAVYPGIDLLYYGRGPEPEYDFVIGPSAAPEQVTLGYEGAESLELDAAGDLLVHLPGGTLRQERPLIYQELEGAREPVAGGNTLLNSSAQTCDELAEPCTDATGTPVYTTYLGGGYFDRASVIAVDPSCAASCSAYITGVTYSPDFPLVNPLPAPNNAQQGVNAFVT
jgi:hypothetical protein